MQFRKRPVVIEAVQLTWDQWNEMCDLIGHLLDMEGGAFAYLDPEDPDLMRLDIHTLEGVMTAQHGDWIIKGIQGEFYPCKPDIFDATYERVEDGL